MSDSPDCCPLGRNWVEALSLHNFRNYTSLKLQLSPAPVVLVGANGAGKTNLLEAISLLSPGQGLRRATTVEFGCFSSGSYDWAVSADVHGIMGEARIGTGVTSNRLPGGSVPGQTDLDNGREVGSETLRRKIRMNGETLSSSTPLGQSIQMLWLTPAMDGLFTGAASERRRFLDRLMLVFTPESRKQWNLFERAMRQRNKLLEDTNASPYLFEGLEMQMAELGVAIAASRLETIERLRGVIAASRDRLNAFPFATIALDGVLETALEEKPAVDVEDDYRRLLSEGRQTDRAAKRTLIGPHRTDLLVGHGPKAMPARYCSTGEQKALLTGLVLAHARLVYDKVGGYTPLLLLDEIAAHFDEIRRHALFDEILALNCQAWMTGTDRQSFTYFGERAQLFTVNDAEIVA
ncbi:MAG: DNA replication and repair protein RecF [Rhodomicrobium sp.]|nr:MAG: DNA replication and repair protein RecF [Rhodomicrobium sp.]